MEHAFAVAEFWAESPARDFSTGDFLPTFSNPMPKIDLNDLAPPIKDDLRTLSGMVDNIDDPVLRSFYQEMVAKQGATIDFFLMARQFQRITADGSGLDRYEIPIAQHAQATNKLGAIAFGAIESERLAAIVSRCHAGAAAHLNDSERDKSLDEPLERLAATLPETDPELADRHLYKPSQEFIDYWKPLLEKKYESLLNLIPDQTEKFNGTQVRSIFMQALQVISQDWGLEEALNWQVEHGMTNIKVDGKNKVIWVPEDTSLSFNEMRGRMVHEPGGHLLRNLLGGLTKDPLVSKAMPESDYQEEGFFSLLEQILTGKPREAGIPYYLGVGMALDSLETGTPTELTNLEQLITDYEILQTKKLPDEDKQLILAKRAFRLRRGMSSVIINGTLYQTVFPEDLKYARGQAPAIQFLTESRGTPAALDDAMLGKYALDRPDEFSYVNELHRHTVQSRSKVPSAA